MQTIKKGNVTFIYNDDFSGNVTIVNANDVVTHEEKSVTLPFKVLLSFMADYKRKELIDAVKKMSDESVILSHSVNY